MYASTHAATHTCTHTRTLTYAAARTVMPRRENLDIVYFFYV
jgi:hypothetical protein